jgi:23S rRNA (cytidine1920-2'-O)/16S rRNA (cytidine1409-2'-O)-methyltransferase
VIVKERLNARYLNNEIYGADRQRASFVVMDVSFISITKILPALIDMCGSDASLEIVSLVKPQFEAGRELLGKGGVIRSAETHLRVLESIDRFVRSQDMGISGWTHSPVKGPAGNIEFLARLLINPDLFAKETDSIDAGLDIKLDLECVVQEAHEALNRKG